MGVLGGITGFADGATQRSPYIILAVVCSAMFLDLSNLSAVTIALPTIGKDLHTSSSQLQWVIAAYALTFGSFLLLGGRGSDLFGHRRILLFGACFFALFTLVCALSPTFISLVIGRAFQGIGAGFTIPSAQAHIAIYFPEPARRAKALGFWAAAGSVGFIAGLILGGVLTDLLTWRWIFWISLILSGLVVPAAYLTLPRPSAVHKPVKAPNAGGEEDSIQEKKFMTSVKANLIRFDVLGICLVIPGLLLLTYALTSANETGWGSAQIILTLILSVVLLAFFIHQEKYTSSALLNLKLFNNASFNLTLVLAILTYAVRQACTFFLTLQLQSFGNSPIHTAVLFLPVGISALVANTIAGRLVPLLGARFMFCVGWALCIPGVVLFSFITPETNYFRFTFPGMILYIAGLGVVYITANFVVVSSASKSDQGAVAGVFNVALQVGGSVLGLAVLSAIADAINTKLGGPGANADNLKPVAYFSVYYSCIILCVLALAISLFAITVPEAMRGSLWKKPEELAPPVSAPGPTKVEPPAQEETSQPIELSSYERLDE